MKKLTMISLAIALALAFASCEKAPDVTINKVNNGNSTDSSTETVSTVENSSSDVVETSSQMVFSSVEETSSVRDTVLPDSVYELSEDLLHRVAYAAGHFHPQDNRVTREYLCERLETVDGVECYVIEVYDDVDTYVATYAFAMDEHSGQAFAYDEEKGSYRQMQLGQTIVLGGWVTSETVKNVYRGRDFTFSYEGIAEEATVGSAVTFKGPNWYLSVTSRPATEEYDLGNPTVRDAIEESDVRSTLEEQGFVFDWVLRSDEVTVDGQPMKRRPFSATHQEEIVDLGTAYYGYVNGRFYQIIAYTTTDENSVSDLLGGLKLSEDSEN